MEGAGLAEQEPDDLAAQGPGEPGVGGAGVAWHGSADVQVAQCLDTRGLDVNYQYQVWGGGRVW